MPPERRRAKRYVFQGENTMTKSAYKSLRFFNGFSQMLPEPLVTA